MTTIRLAGVTKSFGSTRVLEALDLQVRAGEFMVLLGPSGCGKTTSMRIVAGLEEATSGDVFIDERRVNDVPARSRNIAMVFQNYGLYPHMTVAENIAYPLKLRGVAEAEREQRVKRAAARVELEPYLQRKPRELSGGQRQRVALARALIREPVAFLMDEPLSNLDAKLRGSMRSELKHLHHELKTTTLYVTHDQVEAMTLGSRVAVMHQGKLMQLDEPGRVYADPANLFVAGFMGSPPMNFLRGALIDDAFVADGARVAGITVRYCGACIAGFRAEDASLTSEGGAIRGNVFAVEPLGDSTLVTLSCATGRVVVRARKDVRPAIDSALGISVDPERLFLFDPQTERRVRA
jgi:multiple sugar transport system ATP-binding protein